MGDLRLLAYEEAGSGEAVLLVDGIEGARRVEIAGAMHLRSLEQPEAFNVALEGFLFALD